MDKLAKQLRADAERIEVTVSDELDRRINASLRAVEPVEQVPRTAKPPFFWLASTLTGVAAAVAVIAIVNWQSPDEQTSATPVNFVAAVPTIDLKAESAMLTGPLQDELDKLQSDLKKAEEKVKRDIGL
ncbi:MAG: hypothetical protein GWP62_12555 [Gammaproteobacteria bacterium]|jgi:hypothetical protein|nr:hypothetical protein [Gammaproteobacteria bacterium]